MNSTSNIQGIEAKNKIESSFQNMCHHDSVYVTNAAALQSAEYAEYIYETNTVISFIDICPVYIFLNFFRFEYEKKTIWSPFQIVASFLDEIW